MAIRVRQEAAQPMLERQILAQILRTPRDDTPRLEFAEMLEKRGTPCATARAAFIRLQLKAAELITTGPFEAQQLGKVAAEVADDFQGNIDWSNKPSWVYRMVWHRGFVVEVWLRSLYFLPRASTLFGLHPIEVVVLTDLAPLRSGSTCTWQRDFSLLPTRLHASHIVPAPIFDRMTGQASQFAAEVRKCGERDYPNMDEAWGDLSAACVGYGLAEAGIVRAAVYQ